MKKSHISLRRYIQIVATIAQNGYISGFLKGRIYTGASKRFCVPGLNCYSCPGALGACPVGAMQAVNGSTKYSFSWYVCGFIVLTGVLLGRFVCGFLCPFGFIQDVLAKIPIPKLRLPKKLDTSLKFIKYLMLLVFVLLLPVIIANQFGIGIPFFCKYICPAGTLEGGIPLLLANESLRQAAGFLFQWKVLVLLITLIFCCFIPRFFCKYLCPLGAAYSIFNGVCLYQIRFNPEKCTRCQKCEPACIMNVPILTNAVKTGRITSAECIKCGKCAGVCFAGALTSPLV